MKPCQFCDGTELTVEEFDTRDGGMGVTLWAVYCDKCGATSASALSETEARANWNDKYVSRA
jgi:hypothetical protein